MPRTPGSHPPEPDSDKPWREALRQALAKREEQGLPLNMERVAEACVKAAIEGDLSAMKEIGDRLDGKVAQAGPEGGAGPATIEIVHTFKSGI
jgi:hypothetical protein